MKCLEQTLTEMRNPKNWRKTHKKQYEIWMCRPLPGTKVYNFL